MIEVKEKYLKNLKFIDLFAGLGGFRLALESCGAQCIFSSEWDRHAQDVYELNFKERSYGDITKIDENDIPNHDILCAGFPCQAFSISGKQQGFADIRGTLFFDIARIIKAKKPKVIFMENVKNFVKHDDGNTLKVVQDTLNTLGYNFYYKILPSQDYGIPQKRERVYMLAFRDDLHIDNFEFPKTITLNTFVEDLLLDDSLTYNLVINRDDLVLKDLDIKENVNKVLQVGIVGKGRQGERIYSPKGIAITLSAYGGGIFSKTGGYLINGKTRKLHIRECARLMGYPDSYILHKSNSQAYKQLGNSVVIDVLQYIAINIGLALNLDKK